MPDRGVHVPENGRGQQAGVKKGFLDAPLDHPSPSPHRGVSIHLTAKRPERRRTPRTNSVAPRDVDCREPHVLGQDVTTICSVFFRYREYAWLPRTGCARYYRQVYDVWYRMNIKHAE